MEKYNFEEIVTHLKTSGFVFPGSQIYGGLANSWDFGPLGVLLKDNIKNLWKQKFIQEDTNNVQVQAAILMNPKVWQASGHLGGFSDPLMDCRNCKSRYRADKLIEDSGSNINPESLNIEQMQDYIKQHKIACPKCDSHDFTNIRQFNLMFKTQIGVTDDSSNDIYLRPETAQGMFVNFKNVQRSMRKKLPFGIGQIGKSFRNEITPGNFIFRTREFEQMELEFFCKPDDDLKWYKYWQEFCYKWITNLGVAEQNLRLREHDLEELSHYSKATCDIEYQYPFGWGELWGIACRSDYDLKQHQEHSKESLEYLDPVSNEKLLAYCVEPAVGVERLFLMFVSDAYYKEKLDNEERLVMKLHPALAPYKAAILPLSKKLSEPAQKLRNDLATLFSVEYDESGSIGKRYRRQDAIGTPYCITFDFDSLDDEAVTIRDRDTMEQTRIPIKELVNFLQEKVRI
ncbi:MAG: glycine--tRNA ligase [Erysipelotrichaceae bacterium]